MERQPRSETVIFFDVDGVLIDGYHHNPDHRRMWNTDTERDLGIRLNDIDAYFQKYWNDVLIGRQSLHNTLAQHLTSGGYSVPCQTVIHYWMTHDAHINRAAIDFVQKCRTQPGTSLYLATNQEKTRADYLWETLNFKSYFDGLYYSGAIGVTKSDPEFFRHIIADLNLDPNTQDIVYFDDTPACLKSARQAGFKNTILVTDPEFFKSYRGQVA